jgi:hypothetical protein
MTGERRPRTTKPVLAIFLLLLLSAATSTAKYSGGTGEPNDPYRIATPNDLNDIGNHPNDWNGHFVLVNDINMAGYSYTTALIAPDTNSSTDGFQGTAFTGIFDGNDCNISNLTVDTTATDYIGLFGSVGSGGQITALGIENADVNAGTGDFVGPLAGSNAGTISRCHGTGGVSGRPPVDHYGGCAGGLVGTNGGPISNCWAAVAVSYTDPDMQSYVFDGGLVGLNTGTISHCYATGDVAGGAGDIGGLVGHNQSTISNCYATGNVSGAWVGGLVGVNSGPVSNCYATGSATQGAYAGGLVAENFSTISNCYATGTVGGAAYVGGLVGRNYAPISNCYAAGNVTGGALVGGLDGDYVYRCRLGFYG